VRLSILAIACACLVHAQSPSITSVVDPYTGSTVLCPGGLALITGNLMGKAPTVTIAGKHAFDVILPNIGGNRMTIQIPVDAPVGPTTVTLSLASGASSAPFPITLAAYAPILINAASGSVLSPVHQSSGLLVAAGYPAAPGETIVVSAIGLGPTTPVVATGTPAPANVSTATAPSVMLGATVLTGVAATLAPGQIGIYQVSVAVPAGTPAGSYPLSLSIGESPSNSLTLPVGPAPTGPVITSVLDPVLSNAALCPGDLASLSGVNLGANPLVTVGGKAAFIVAPPQNGNMVIQIPVDAPLGSVNVVANGSPPFAITLAQFAPVLYNSTSGSVISPAHQSTGAPVTASNPALPNETIVVFAIGLGLTNPVVPTGTPAPTAVPTVYPPNVMLSGATPLSGTTATLVPGQVGLYQITFQIPASPPTGFPNFWVGMSAPGTAAASNVIEIAVSLAVSMPTIEHLANNYSYTLPGLPNYGIAQGSIFDIFGSNLTGVPTGLQSVPLPLKLGGVTVDVSVNGTVTHGPLYYVTPGQIAGILPSATPVGDGTITVTNVGGSASAPIHVVQSAFGILTLNGAGSGPASAFDLNYRQLGFTNALNPGDYFVLWGSGVGPVTGDETVTQSPADLTNVPFSIEVGGQPAQLVYHGRSLYPGLDQVIGIVPPGVMPGCWVSVVARSGNMVSNFATLPVAASGRTCSEPTLGLTASQMQTLLSKNSFQAGMMVLQKSADSQFSISGLAIGDNATAAFLGVQTADFTRTQLGPSMGSCLVIAGTNGAQPWGTLKSTALNAGDTIHITGAAGTAGIQYQSNPSIAYGTLSAFGSYLIPSGLILDQNTAGAYTGAIDASPNSLFISNGGGGQFTFDNGSGGSDVGQFQASLTLASPLISWPQAAGLNGGSAGLSGLTVNWSGGDPNGFVLISGRSTYFAASNVITEFTCAAPSAAGQFTIPDSVARSMPTGSIQYANPAFVPVLQLVQSSLPQTFSAPSLDFATIQAITSVTIVVAFK